MSDLNISKTILEQLGGQQFITMTGIKNFVGDDASLSMTLNRNALKANFLVITLRSDDLYNMEFFKNTNGKINMETGTYTEPEEKLLKSYEGVYADQLRILFTEATGFHTFL